MIGIESAKRAALLTITAIMVLVCLSAAKVKAQTVWVVCTWDTSSMYQQKDGKERFERRFYVTDLIQTTTNVYVALTNHVPGLEQPCGEYLEKTVLKAAQERGEGIESGTLKVLKNIEDSGEDVGSRNRWTYAPREKIEQKRAEMIKDAKDGGRVIMPFNWDLSGHNEAADLAKERRRGPASLADAPVKQPTPPQTSQTNRPTATTSKPPATTNYIFGWARVLTTVQGLDKRSANGINRAYYSNIIAFVPTADANALKSQVTTYFNQLGPAYAMKVNEKMAVKDVSVKTFPTLYEADNARYGMATQDYNGLNGNIDVPLPVSYFNWNFYGSRKDLFPNLSEFVTTGYVSNWEFIVVEATAEKRVNGEAVHETRYYVSYPYELFMSGTESIKKTNHLDSYFTKTVVGPAGQRGTKLSYYTDGFEIFPASSPYKTFAEAWAARTERVDTIKGNGYPQYDFLVISNGPNKGEATSFPFCAATCTGERSRVTALEMMKK